MIEGSISNSTTSTSTVLLLLLVRRLLLLLLLLLLLVLLLQLPRLLLLVLLLLSLLPRLLPLVTTDGHLSTHVNEATASEIRSWSWQTNHTKMPANIAIKTSPFSQRVPLL